jgi:hypothetical protein
MFKERFLSHQASSFWRGVRKGTKQERKTCLQDGQGSLKSLGILRGIIITKHHLHESEPVLLRATTLLTVVKTGG